MKSIKVLFLAALFTAFAARGFGDSPNKENPEAYQKEKIDINRDLAQIHAQKNNIKSLKAQLKQDCKADRDMAVIVDKKELRKARADLLKSRLYLRADKKDLKADHKLAMKNLSKEINKDQASLKEARINLEKCKTFGTNCDPTNYSVSIAQYEKRIAWNKKQLTNEEEGLRSDMTAISKSLDNDHYTAVFNVERTTASSDKTK